MEKWEKIGVVGIDTATLWMGDPCYMKYLPEDKVDISRANSPKEWTYPKTVPAAGRPGVGVSVNTYGADGTYDVLAKKDSKGRVMAVKIVFQDKEI